MNELIDNKQGQTTFLYAVWLFIVLSKCHVHARTLPALSKAAWSVAQSTHIALHFSCFSMHNDHQWSNALAPAAEKVQMSYSHIVILGFWISHVNIEKLLQRKSRNASQRVTDAQRRINNTVSWSLTYCINEILLAGEI